MLNTLDPTVSNPQIWPTFPRQIPTTDRHLAPQPLVSDDVEIKLADTSETSAPLNAIPLLLLRRLAVDEQLRAELEAAPVETLARHGVHIAPEQMPAAVSLPSSEAMEGALRIYASGEDETAKVRFSGFLGGLIDLIGGLFGDD